MVNNTNLPPAVTTAFLSAYQDYTRYKFDNLGGIYTRETTDKNIIDDYWLGPVGKAQKMASDEAVGYEGLAEYKATLKTEVWKVPGFRYDRKQNIDRNVAQYAAKSREIMDALAVVPDEEVVEYLKNGESQKAFDGVNYFSAASGKRLNNNILTATGADDEKKAEDGLKKARTYFRRAKVWVPSPQGGESRAASLRANTILAPPEMQDALLTVLRSTGNLGENRNANVINPLGPTYGPGWNLVITELLPDNDKTFYVFDSTKKPLFWISQRQPGSGMFVRMVVNDKDWEDRNFIGVSGELWGGAGYGFPIAAAKVKVS